MIFRETSKLLNEIYKPLEMRCAKLIGSLGKNGLRAASGWYNGHCYRKDEEGSYITDLYPIPVISIEKLCDIEIEFEKTYISTKLSRASALSYDYGRLNGATFEAYGIDNYLCDLFLPQMSFEHLKQNICDSAEEEIGFSFHFSPDTDDDRITEFLLFLKDEGFYY